MNQHKYVTALIIVLVGVGATAATALAIKYVPLGVPQILNLGPKPAVTEMQGVIGTTTSIGAGTYTAPPTPDEGPRKPTYGPLTNTYTDPKTGFSFKYPDELRVADAGDGLALQSAVDKQFSLKICGANDLCSDGFVPGATKSIADLETEYVTTGQGVIGTEYIVPRVNATVLTHAGISVLKQTYVTKILDGNGNDITAQECETCVGEKTRYVLFKSSKDFFILRPGQFNDPSIEAKIIQSITY